jgi:tRNA pseudouridine55 synthase
MVLIDKASGPTSRDVSEAVGRVFKSGGRRKRGAGRFRVGHAGTLDPLATGLLVVLVGRGTRLQTFLQGLPKRYTATVRLGVATDSLDRDGAVTGHQLVPDEPGDLAALAARFTGEIEQVPPVISALKRGGRSLHELARAGHDPEPPPPRAVRIESLALDAGRWGAEPDATASDGELRAVDGRIYELMLDVTCGAGTYVRSLARDLAGALGTVGCVHALRRLRVGPFDVADAVALDAGDEFLRAALRPLADALPHLPSYRIDADQAARLRQGQQPEPAWVSTPVPPLFRLLDGDGQLVAVGRRHEESGGPATAAVFPPAGPDLEDAPCA